jgi:hypothetical protein
MRQSLEYRDPYKSNVEQDQPSHWDWPQATGGGGCTFLCATAYTEQAVGLNIGISFTYDRYTDKAIDASFNISIDKTAAFVGPNPPRGQVVWSTVPPEYQDAPLPSIMNYSFDPHALSSLSDDQVAALASAAINKMVPGQAQAALIALINGEKALREKDEKRKKDDQQ